MTPMQIVLGLVVVAVIALINNYIKKHQGITIAPTGAILASLAGARASTKPTSTSIQQMLSLSPTERDRVQISSFHVDGTEVPVFENGREFGQRGPDDDAIYRGTLGLDSEINRY